MLIKAESKLKFDFKKNSEISYFEFNISPTIANKKIKHTTYDIRYTTLNPLQVNLHSNYLTQKINENKGFIYQVILKNVPFSAAITNDTQNIFITCQNLNGAKKL